LPGNPLGLDAWPLGDGNYLVNDTNVDYPEIEAEAKLAQALATPMTSFSMMASSLSTVYAYSNPVYLTNMAASFASDRSITASFSIAGGTNFVPYDILTATNLFVPENSWNWIGVGYTSNNYTFHEQPKNTAFYMLARPAKTMTFGWGGDVDNECDVPYGVTNILMVAAGYGYSLGLFNNGTVVGWGDSIPDGWVPTNLVNNVTMVACGWNHNVALLTNGTVQAWGANEFGVLNVPANTTNVTVISAQALHTLALCSNGTVVAWGDNQYGQSVVPAGLTNVTAIAAGGEHSLAVSNGFVVAWGDDFYHQCDVPLGLSNVWDVAGSGFHSLALLKNETVVAWGDDTYGETNVPAGLSNVVAIAAGGDGRISDADMGDPLPYSMALKKDGTVITWGAGLAMGPMQGVSNVISISGGLFHALAIRTGPRTPIITLEPTDEYQILGGNVTFTARGAGLYGVTYQWQTNGMHLNGATNATLTVTNVQQNQLGFYNVVVTDNGGMGSIVSSNASLYIVTPPVILGQSPLSTNEIVVAGSDLALGVTATATGANNGFPISYQWQFDGTNIAFATSSNYTVSALNSGTYTLTVSNSLGSTNVSWLVDVIYPGMAAAWGDNTYGECAVPPGITNIMAIAAGEYHCVAVEDNGQVIQWGYNWGNVPANLTNAVAVSAGYDDSIALRSDGTVVTWGTNTSPANYVPSGLAGVKAVACGWSDNVVLLTNGTVEAWGLDGEPLGWGDMTDVTGLTNITAISASGLHALALSSNGTVMAWGDDREGECDVPVTLSNVVAVAAGGQHSLALKADGTVVAWGYNATGQCSVPVGLSNIMGIAAGWAHSVALKNDGTMVSWGDDSAGQTNTPSLTQVKLIASGGDHTIASVFSPTTTYQLDVSKDLLLIYNTNSQDSSTVENYYLQNRPMVSSANVLGIGCPGIFITNGGSGVYSPITNTTDYETVTLSDFTNQIFAPLLTWLNNNPTKRPQYIILFLDVPSRVNSSATNAANYPYYMGIQYPSVSYLLESTFFGWNPFVTSINMNGPNGTNDCIGYINKLAYIGTNYSPGKLVISACAGGYGNTNYYFDGVGGFGNFAADAKSGVLSINNSASIIYSNSPIDIVSNHIATGSNVAGYECSGAHSALMNKYATNGFVQWAGNSGWWIIQTVESYNGQRYETIQGNFLQWYSSSAFGGTNYSNTPIGAVSHVDEPTSLGVNNSFIYFGLWESEKNFAICAWNSRATTHFQAVGDPFTIK
jgi:alpha-tubulin suppressor-like RCC1 family protein